MKATELKNELNRIADKIDEADKTGCLLVHYECGDFNQPNPVNPYPIFFTGNQLLHEINQGHWHCVHWRLEKKEVVQQAILKRIQELQNLLIKI